MELFKIGKNNINSQDDFLNDIRLENQITFKSMDKCLQKNEDLIKNIKSIFTLRNKTDAQMLITIPKLLFKDNEANSIVSFIKNQSTNFTELEPDIENYKEIIITSFYNNPSFFAMAWNWCGLIRQEIQMQAKQKEQNQSEVEYVYVDVVVFIQNPRQQHQKASGSKTVQDIGEWPVNVNNKYFGRLWIRDFDGEVKFIFQFQEYKEKPDFLEVKCRTGNGEERTILLNEIEINDEEDKELIIRSGIIDNFDYSDVEILEVKLIKNV